MKIINLTQHQATPEQIAAGVFDSHCHEKSFVSSLLTFEEIPSQDEMDDRAADLAYVASCCDATHAMIGGAPFFMSTLEKVLIEEGITPLYAFSKRESVDLVKEDGSVVKTAVFKHCGFVTVEKY